MKLKRFIIMPCLAVFFVQTLIAIKGCKNAEPAVGYTLVRGTAGYPRFNLQFSGGTYNDIDLYVATPNGSVISFKNRKAQKGKMDIDCLCGDCPDGANENIFWKQGEAPKGTYKVWAEYFDPCVVQDGSADYTIRIMKGQEVLQIFSGELSTHNRRSGVYTFVY